MATRAPFLTQPYGAYYHRDVPTEDEELTHVGPGTPCGEYLRRFWQPVALSKAVQELPRRVRILGEDLVVFRDQSGRVGCLELHCPHRGTSLEFGLIAEQGIRCCYHGWLMDVDGRILDTPGEPAESTLKDRLCQGAYPTHEYQGMIFAYLGPPAKKPVFPVLDTYNQPGCRMVPLIQHFYPCNWLQMQENVMDPAHLEFLHTITCSHFPDGGLIMLRHILRRGIRAVQAGQDPAPVRWEGGQVIPTYSNHTVLPVPKAPTPEAEAQLLRDTGRQVAEGYLKDHASLVEHTA